MENIFKNAQFGKAYKTRDGRKAIFVSKSFVCVKMIAPYKSGIIEFNCNHLGSHIISDVDGPYSILDIVSEWNEPINEEDLDQLARDEYPKGVGIFTPQGAELLQKAFKRGYKKAKGVQDDKRNY